MVAMHPEPLQVKKYPNRRLYDRTNSRHLTRDELYDLVAAGTPVTVVDSRTGRDITNAVLVQVLVDRDPERLAALPPVVMHLLVQGNETLVARVLERTLGWLADASREAQRPFDEWMRMAAAAMPAVPGGTASTPPSPFDPFGLVRAMSPPAGGPSPDDVPPGAGTAAADAPGTPAPGGTRRDEDRSPERFAELQQRIRALEDRLRRLEIDDAD